MSAQSAATMIACPTVQKSVIRNHYNLTTLFYRLLWGRHIHHGLWNASESPAVAQVQLTETLTGAAGIQQGETVLDVGCGMGGSSIHLAKILGCQVTGITLSRLQRCWAGWSSFWRGTAGKTTFRCVDAEKAEFDAATFDVVWSIECTEHLFDKPAFFHKAGKWLKPGGRMAICAWLAGDDISDGPAAQQVYDVCEGFFCPSLGSAGDYRTWMEQAGLLFDDYQDWTDRVAPTWEICLRRVERTRMKYVARLLGVNTAMFVDRFQTILDAYRSRAMRYGCFVAHRPE